MLQRFWRSTTRMVGSIWVLLPPRCSLRTWMSASYPAGACSFLSLGCTAHYFSWGGGLLQRVGVLYVSLSSTRRVENSEGHKDLGLDEEYSAVVVLSSERTVRRSSAFRPEDECLAHAKSTATRAPAGWIRRRMIEGNPRRWNYRPDAHLLSSLVAPSAAAFGVLERVGGG